MDEDAPVTRVGIILNPKHARTNHAYADLMTRLRAARIHYRSLSTTVWRDGARQAEQLRDWGAEVIVILGGDGTIRAAAPILADSGTPVLLVPTGTANVLSRHIGIHTHRQAIDHCAHVLSALATTDELTTIREVRVPVNDVEFCSQDGQWRDSHFVSLAGVGGDARAVAEHSRGPGVLGYALGALKALFAPTFTAAIRTAAPSHPQAAPPRSVWSVMASKVARPAGPIVIFPGARIDEEHFELLTVGPLAERARHRLGQWAGIARNCLQGRPAAARAMDYRTASRVTMTLEPAAPLQLDGDLIGDCCRLRLNTGRRRLRVLAPTI